MCDEDHSEMRGNGIFKTIPVAESIGTVLAHDITEIRPGEFKGRAFKKGHVIQEDDVCHLQRLGKDRLYVLDLSEDEMHEDDAAQAIAGALMGEGVGVKGEPSEGKITIIAERDGLLSIKTEALSEFNMTGDLMCSTLHTNTVVKKGQTLAGTRAIPLVVKKETVENAVEIAERAGNVISVKELRKPRAGIVITGNEVYYGRIKDAFAPIITKKVQEFGGDVVGIYYTPDDESQIEARLRELIDAGADILFTTGGMSVDPSDVTRFAISRLGATGVTYGSPVLPGAMFLVAYVETKSNGGPERTVPVLGIPACGMYSKITVLDLVLPRVLAGERIGRRELAELGHGGMCMKCDSCRYPVCPFGK